MVKSIKFREYVYEVETTTDGGSITCTADFAAGESVEPSAELKR